MYYRVFIFICRKLKYEWVGYFIFLEVYEKLSEIFYINILMNMKFEVLGIVYF